MIQRQKISQYRSRGRRRSRMSRLLHTERLETRALLAGDLMQNPVDASDVNDDGYTTPLDALLVINELNSLGAHASTSGAAAAPAGQMFYDVNGDAFVTPLDALLVLNELNAEAEDEDDVVQIRLSVTDTEGQPIDAIEIDQDFQLHAYVQDLTGRDDGGVFAAYTDIIYTDSSVIVSGDIIHNDDDFPIVQSGDASLPGLIDEVGGCSCGTQPTGPMERLLFTVPMTATANGLATFEQEPADDLPSHLVLVYGEPDELPDPPVVPPDQVAYLSTSLQVGTSDAPIAEPDFYTGVVNEILSVDQADGVLANDTDPTGGSLTANLVDDVLNGSLTLNPDGSFEYTPNPGVESDSFTYFASNVGATSDIVTVSIDLLQPNRPPVAVDDEYTTDEDVPHIEIEGVLINDTDPDGDQLSARLITSPSNGQLDFNDVDGTFTYTPNPDFSGVDTFTYVANDGQEDSNVATATITVNEVIDPPVAEPDFYATPIDTVLVRDAAQGVLANDTPGEGGDLSAVLVTSTTFGGLDLQPDGSFTYTPDFGFQGTDEFTYYADENGTQSNTTSVTIDVVGESVVAFRLQVSNLAGDPITAISPGGRFMLHGFIEDISPDPQDGVFAAYMDVVYSSDLASVDGEIVYSDLYPNQRSGDTSVPGEIDEVGAFDGFEPLGPGELLLYSVPMVASDVEGTVTFETNPADDLPTNDTLLFNVDDPIPPELIDYGRTTLEIVAGDPPIAVDDEYMTDEDVTLDVPEAEGVLANDVDPDGDELFAVLVSDPLNGELQLNLNGSFVYTPDANFFGVDTFEYQASDGGNLSNVAVVTIVVNSIDDVPIAVDDFYRTEGTDPLDVSAEDGVLVNDIEVEGEMLTAQLEEGATNGNVDLRDDGSFLYTPNAGFVGRDTFTYRAVAGGVESNIATVSIDVGDLTPSDIRGFVYFDTNNDGILGFAEDRFGDVELTLRGTDLLGNEIFETTKTAADGSYEFTGIRRGNYMLTQFQPMYIVDGKDTIDGMESMQNDRFLIDLPAGVVAGDYNFGERGLEARFINNTYFFASRVLDGLSTKIGSDGDSQWYSSDEGWDRYESVQVRVSNNNTVAEITTTDSTGFTQTSTVRLPSNQDVTVQYAEDGLLIRFHGLPQDHGLQPAPLSAQAVDAAFSR